MGISSERASNFEEVKMDAVEFVEQWRRMDKNGYRKYSIFNDSPEDVIAEVEEWAKMNPVKTR